MLRRRNQTLRLMAASRAIRTVAESKNNIGSEKGCWSPFYRGCGVLRELFVKAPQGALTFAETEERFVGK